MDTHSYTVVGACLCSFPSFHHLPKHRTMDILFWLLIFTCFSFLLLFLTLSYHLFAGKCIGDPNYAPVKGTVLHQLLYFNKLFDQQTEMARTVRTFRLLAPRMSELYTADPRNVEHVLRWRFDKYSKGKYNQEVVRDLLGEGIFAVDGDKWRKQRKLASFEFSNRVLRDFSCSAFRANAAKLVRLVSDFSHYGMVFDMQQIRARTTMAAIVSWLLAFTSISIFVLLFTFFIPLAISLFAGKSIGDPRYAPVKGTVFHLLFHFHRLFDYQTETARTLRTFRLLSPGMSEHYTTDPRNVEHVLRWKFEEYSKGKYNQEILRDLFGQGIFAVDGKMWRQQRKLASFEFSTRVLRDFSSSAFRSNAGKLVRLVSKFSEEGLVFDMQDILMRCTLDSIFKVGFGVELNCLEGTSQEGSEFMKAFDESNALVYWRYVDPLWKIKRFLNIGSEAALKNNVKFIDHFVNRVIDSKRRNLAMHQHHNDKEDILSRFVMESKKDPETMNDKYLRDIILNFMIAGKDTSANTLSWFLYMMCKNPLVQEKIAQEVRHVTCTQETKPNIDDFVANITEATLEKMHYLHAALTETLRLYPAVPVDGRTAETDDILPDGYKLKKGDGVYYMAYAMGRMRYIWGDDAGEFRPERWLQDSTFQPQSPFKFIAFHAGPRICLGKDFAYRQMKIVAMALLRFFIFKLDVETRTVTYKTMFTLHIDKGLPIRAIPRP